MDLYIKQRIFTWGDSFDVYDSDGNTVFTVEGEIFTFGKKLHLYDLMENELAYIEQELLTFLPKYRIYKGDEEVCEIVKEFTFFHPEYTVTGPELEWRITGDFFDHDYSVMAGDRTVATVSKEWLTWGDTYAIWIDSSVDHVTALSVVLVIDACLDAQRN